MQEYTLTDEPEHIYPRGYLELYDVQPGKIIIKHNKWEKEDGITRVSVFNKDGALPFDFEIIDHEHISIEIKHSEKYLLIIIGRR